MPNEIHPMALLIPATLIFHSVFCIVVEKTLFDKIQPKLTYYNSYITHRVQACKSILQFSFSILAISKRGITPTSCARTPHPLVENMIICDTIQNDKKCQCDMNVWNDAFKLT